MEVTFIIYVQKQKKHQNMCGKKYNFTVSIPNKL